MADQMKASILRIYYEIGIEDKTPVELPNKVGREFDFS